MPGVFSTVHVALCFSRISSFLLLFSLGYPNSDLSVAHTYTYTSACVHMQCGNYKIWRFRQIINAYCKSLIFPHAYIILLKLVKIFFLYLFSRDNIVITIVSLLSRMYYIINVPLNLLFLLVFCVVLLILINNANMIFIVGNNSTVIVRCELLCMIVYK